jgi:esterase
LSAVELNFDTTGTASGATGDSSSSGGDVVIVHGLFGQGRNWAGIAKALGQNHRIITADLRNHGASPWADEMTYEGMAEDVAHLIEAHTSAPVTLVGHSMGGKAAMTLALTQPDLIGRLCILDIAPVAYGHDFEAHLMAMSNMDVASMNRRSEAEAALLEALGDINLARFLVRNLKSDPEHGNFTWSVNLSALAAHMDDILDFPIFEADDAYEGPALFLAGGASDYIQPYHQAEIERLFPMAETEIVAGAGHWLHAEQPDTIINRLAQFLASS